MIDFTKGTAHLKRLLPGILIVFSLATQAQTSSSFIKDAAHCKDHSLVSRTPDFVLFFCQENTAPGPVLIDVTGSGDVMQMKTVGTRRTDQEYNYISKFIERPDPQKYLPTIKRVIEQLEQVNLLRTAERIRFFENKNSDGSLSVIYKNKIDNIAHWIILSISEHKSHDGYTGKTAGYTLRVITVNEK